MYHVFTIADAFIRKGIEEGKPLTHLQVQKLCFLAQGYNLALLNTPLFNEEVKAWPYGPVIPTLYTQLKRFGREEIRESEPLPAFSIKEEDHNTRDLIDVIYRNYGHLSGGQLSTITHMPGTPWANAWYEEKFSTITTESIKKYYIQELKEFLQ